MKFHGKMNFAHMNTRREKAGEGDGPIAVDLKFADKIGVKALGELFSTPAAFKKIVDQHYTKDDELLTTDIEVLRLATAGENMSISIDPVVGKEPSLKFKDGKLDKITLKLQPRRIAEVSFRVIVHPTETQHGRLANLLSGDVVLSAAGDQAEITLEHEEEAGA